MSRLDSLGPRWALERLISDEMLYTIDRNQVTNHLVANNNLDDSFDRDYGVELTAKLSDYRFAYAMALMGGNGANNGHSDTFLDLTWGPLSFQAERFYARYRPLTFRDSPV